MKQSCFLAMSLLLGLTAMTVAQGTPEGCLKRLNAQVEALLAKNPPSLFAWHLRSLRALAATEFAKLDLGAPRTRAARADAPDPSKDFVQFVGTISDGLDRDCGDPDNCLKRGKRPLILARPSDIDGSLQYMMVDLPAGWDPSRSYPLSVALHGSGPENPLAYPSFGFGPPSPSKVDAPADPMAGMIHLTPWGRGNRGWRHDAEHDLFEALSVLHTFAKTDPDRWYITGHSSGADGLWAILQHTPDLWAAAGLQSGSMRYGRPEWGLIPNMVYVPTYFLVGEKDLPQRMPEMKEAYELLRKAGAETELSVLPGVGHYPLTEEGLRGQAAWMVKHVRHRPDHFTFTVDDPRHLGVWGVSVVFPRDTQLIQSPWPVFTCEVKGQEVHITAANAKELRVATGAGGLGLKGDVKLWVNGKLEYEGSVQDVTATVKVP